MDLHPALAETAGRQRGIVHRHQLYAVGVTRAQLRWQLGRDWQAVLPGVVALFTGRLDHEQRLIAAWLYAGSDATITGIEAARRHGIRYLPPPGTVHLFVNERRKSRRAGFAVVRASTRVDPSSRMLAGLRCASPARAVVDAAPFLPGPRAVEAVVLQVVQRRLATLPTLRHELERAPNRSSLALRAGVIAAEAGVWSAPEADCLRLLRSSQVLPEILPNATLKDSCGVLLPTPDFWIQDVGLGVQIHSREHHTEGEDFDNTLDDDGTLTAAGATILGITPAQLTKNPLRHLRRVEATYLSLRTEGRQHSIQVVRIASA